MMIDATCKKCHKRLGWSGMMKDMPKCPRCGYRPPDEELLREDRDMEAIHELLKTRPNESTCSSQRIAAGLTLGQAAVRLGITRDELKDFESGVKELPDGIIEGMKELYGVE